MSSTNHMDTSPETDISRSESHQDVWAQICSEAQAIAQKEPVLNELLHSSIIDRESLEEALSYRISRKLGHHAISEPYLHDLFFDVFRADEKLIKQVRRDIVAIDERDAACESVLFPFLYFKGFQAITAYRVAHYLWNHQRKDIALYLQSIISQVFAVDIHPAARIGCGILMDHATGVVIGETAVVEDDVSMLHEVTLGGTGKVCGDRHPKVRKGVLIGSGSKILGNIEIGEGARIGAGSVVLNNVPPHSTVVGVPAKVVGQERVPVPAYDMDHTLCEILKPLEGLDFNI